MTAPDPRALVTEHLDAVWARASARTPPGQALEVTVGAFRSVPAGSVATRAALLAATDRIARHRAGTGITDLTDRTDAPEPRPDLELVLRRVTDPDDDAPTVAPPRSRRPLLLTLGLVLLLGSGAVVVQQRGSAGPGPSRDVPSVAASPPVPQAVAAARAADAARAASAALSARSAVPSVGDLLLDQHLARCAAAVAGSGRRGDYPDPVSWSVTSSQVGRTGVATAVSTTTSSAVFFCATTPETTSVSVPGPTGGAPTFVEVGAFQLGLLNPREEPLRVSVDGTAEDVSGPAVLLGVTPRSRVRVTPGAAGGAGTPAPVDPVATAITVTDQPVGAQDRRSPANRHLADCLGGQTGTLVPDRDAWRTVDASVPGALLARAPGMAGLCVDGPDGAPAIMTVQPVLDPAPDGQLAVVGTLGAVAGGPASYVLVSLDPRTVKLVATRGSEQLTCVVGDGLALCTGSAATPGLTRLTALGPDGSVVAGPVQQ